MVAYKILEVINLIKISLKIEKPIISLRDLPSLLGTIDGVRDSRASDNEIRHVVTRCAVSALYSLARMPLPCHLLYCKVRVQIRLAYS